MITRDGQGKGCRECLTLFFLHSLTLLADLKVSEGRKAPFQAGPSGGALLQKAIVDLFGKQTVLY
jgi:hypothetical protein